MKRLFASVALIGVIGTSTIQAAFDGSIGMTDTPGRTGQGGPFTINVMTADTALMQQVQSAGSQFLSFCIEKSETISLIGNQGYKVNVAQGAVDGGIGGGNPDPISLATGWLYSQFRASGLNALFIANSGSIDAGRAALQQAIWYLEEEQSSANTGSYLVTAAINALAGNGVNSGNVRTVNANGAFDVRVLNVFDASGVNKLQDQLALVPEPSAYITAVLLLIPLLVEIRRRRRSVQ